MSAQSRRGGATTAPPRVGDRVRYCRTFAGAWTGLSEWIEAEVATWDYEWEARCSTEFPDETRRQWNVRKVFPTRDKAAAFAAAFVIKSEELVAAILAGGDPPLPNDAMRVALARELPEQPGVRAARMRLDVAATDSELRRARDDLRAAESDAELAWWRSHDWRDFVAVDSKPLAAEPKEEDHDRRITPAA